MDGRTNEGMFRLAFREVPIPGYLQLEAGNWSYFRDRSTKTLAVYYTLREAVYERDLLQETYPTADKQKLEFQILWSERSESFPSEPFEGELGDDGFLKLVDRESWVKQRVLLLRIASVSVPGLTLENVRIERPNPTSEFNKLAWSITLPGEPIIDDPLWQIIFGGVLEDDWAKCTDDECEKLFQVSFDIALKRHRGDRS